MSLEEFNEELRALSVRLKSDICDGCGHPARTVLCTAEVKAGHLTLLLCSQCVSNGLTKNVDSYLISRDVAAVLCGSYPVNILRDLPTRPGVN